MVGLDGSEGSAAALRWTIDLAKTIDAEVIALHAFELPYRAFAPPAGGAAFGVSTEVGSSSSRCETARRRLVGLSGAPRCKRLVSAIARSSGRAEPVQF
ncbi:MAG: universal stress protein [Candidatus Dormibacter sp.]